MVWECNLQWGGRRGRPTTFNIGGSSWVEDAERRLVARSLRRIMIPARSACRTPTPWIAWSMPEKQLETPIPCHITHLTMLISKDQQSEAGTKQNQSWTLISINRKQTLVLHQNKKMTVAPVTSFWPVFDWCGDKRVGLPQHLACICTAEVWKPDVRPASFFAHGSYRSVYTQEGWGTTSYS